MSYHVRCLITALEILAARLAYLDDEPTHPGGDREYRDLLYRYAMLDARIDRALREEMD